jgi:hypothetical protein
LAHDRAAFDGQLSDLPVGELLRTIVIGKQTGVARFETNLGSATVWFRSGQLVDADMGRFHMEAAIRRLLQVDEGSFEVEFKPVSRRQLISEPTQTLLGGPVAPGAKSRRLGASWTPGGASDRVPPPPRPTSGDPTSATSDEGERIELGSLRIGTAAPPEGVTIYRSASPPAITGNTVIPTGAPSTPAAAPIFAPPPPVTGRPARPSLVQTPAAPMVAKPAAARPVAPARTGETKPSPTRDPIVEVDEEDRTLARPAPAGLHTGPREDRPTQRIPRQGPPRAQPDDDARTAEGPRIPADEDPSGPISVGTVFDAPASGASGTTATPTDAPIKRGPERTAAYPSVPQEFLKPRPQGRRPGRRARAEGIAAKIGLHPGASTTGAMPPAVDESEQPPPDEAPPAPATVGRYEVLLRIARGGMGTVYLCRITGEGGFRRLFALKVIRDHLSRNQEYVGMLLQEARIASRLHHPNVVGIVDIGMLQGQHYLVMDYVEGCTFSELLKMHPKARPPHLIIPVVIDALTGLHAAHCLTDDDGSPLSMVHCDVSPQNMLVGVNGIARITDFGIAKASDALTNRANRSRGARSTIGPTCSRPGSYCGTRSPAISCSRATAPRRSCATS